ncbi:uncharacterized protein F5147DRAFT_693718 [Suillus discolor]|uniref:Secreted protein n=1 Tax=Suillus discolor TaxID=1912936 RepID=A0A9P7F8U1_9AGAM|nr:uncharacterized protein F5147DRAFT_693718 [Suillus discolor]KAG2109029.1 hypothetical protein F5147DRAFT_693718 [Suillus discolor]
MNSTSFVTFAFTICCLSVQTILARRHTVMIPTTFVLCHHRDSSRFVVEIEGGLVGTWLCTVTMRYSPNISGTVVFSLGPSDAAWPQAAVYFLNRIGRRPQEESMAIHGEIDYQ